MNRQQCSMMAGLSAATILAAGALVGCGGQGGGETDTAGGDGSADASQSYVFGVIAKAQGNPVFQAARAGAFAAAEDIEEANPGVEVTINWRTPNNEDAQKQSEFVELLTSQGVDGLAISVSDANLLTSALSAAVESNVPVATFDSDAPDSGRFAYYGVDDKAAGAMVMEQLADVMGGEGTVAILSGNPNSANLSARVAGVREKAAEFDGIEVRDVYYVPTETATDMAAKMQQVQTSEPDITGWALVGGWPLYTDNALDGIYESAKIVSMDPLPLPLEYVKAGQVQVLVGQPYFGWGYESVMMLFDKVHNGQDPEQVFNFAEFDIVTGENAETFASQWNEWLGDDGGE
ncbi:MAG: substrate-binding domain-containing protein [Planctomycetota bacterium]